MWERIAAVAAPTIAGVVGILVKRTRRVRLRENAEAYTNLAAIVETTDAAAAEDLRLLVKEMIHRLVEEERKILDKKFDPASLFAAMIFAVPSALIFVWVWGGSEWWRLVLLIWAGTWTVGWLMFGATQLWTTPEQREKEKQKRLEKKKRQGAKADEIT